MKLLILLGLVLPAMSRDMSSLVSSPFVVGGSNSNIEVYPHQLSLRINNNHACGASLISTTKAVTAAHCVGQPESSYSILGGATERTDTDGPTSVLINKVKIVAHPQFAEDPAQGFPNDIAVLIFDPVTFNPKFLPIEIASPADGDFVGDDCTITGWGKTAFISGSPIVLQEAAMTPLTNAACSTIIPQVNAGHICVAAPTSGACNGDSGGPLVCKNKLVGATSFGNLFCSPAISPSVYSRVSYFHDWILAQ